MPPMNESMQNMSLPRQKNQGTGVHNCNFVHTARDSFSFLKCFFYGSFTSTTCGHLEL